MLELRRHLTRPLRTGPLPCLLEARAELVVHPPLLLVAENVVRLLHFLKPLLSRLVVWIQIRVIFLSQLAIGLLNVVPARTTGQTQNFVVVFTHVQIVESSTVRRLGRARRARLHAKLSSGTTRRSNRGFRAARG